MKAYVKQLILNKEEYYETHLNLVNAIARLHLTPREIEVLLAFMTLNGELASDRFSTLSRRKVKFDLDLSDSGLSNIIGSLRRKKCIITKEDHVEIHSILYPKNAQQSYIFKLICNEDDTQDVD